MNNKIIFNEAIRELVLKAKDYNFGKFGKYYFHEIVYALRESFKNPETHIKIFGSYCVNEGDSLSEGFCMYSTYYLYDHAGRDLNWKIMRTPDHWWIIDLLKFKPFDVTYCQFPYKFEYEYGVPEQRIGKDKDFTIDIQAKAALLGKCAGLE